MKNKQIAIVMITLLLLAFTAYGQQTLPQELTVATIVPLEPKKEGVIRIGVVTIKTQIKQDSAGQDIAELIRTRWYSFLNGPTINLIPLDARIPSQINIEAGQKECDYILYSTVSQKSKGSLFGGFLKVAVPILTSAVPDGNGGGATTSIVQSMRQSVQEGAKNAAKNLANESVSKIKARDEVTLEFNFVKVNATSSTVTNSLKTKAKTDGEDIFSPLIEKAAEQIAEAAIKG